MKLRGRTSGAPKVGKARAFHLAPDVGDRAQDLGLAVPGARPRAAQPRKVGHGVRSARKRWRACGACHHPLTSSARGCGLCGTGALAEDRVSPEDRVSLELS